MRLSYWSAIALTVAEGVSAFTNASPFFLLSTSKLHVHDNPPSIMSASTLETLIANLLESCRSHYYLLVSQPGATASDFSQGTLKKTMPSIARAWSDEKSYKSRQSIVDVVGAVDVKHLSNYVMQTCETKSTIITDATSQGLPDITSPKQVIEIEFPTLSQESEKRRQQLVEHDAYLQSVIERVQGKDFTMLYFSTPRSSGDTQSQMTSEEMEHYEMDESPFVGVLHSDLKRDVGQMQRRQNGTSNQTMIEGPLFDKYQFLSPGIFMGGLASILLLVIGYVGVSALSSLQVTYAAFDKEQGQLASKKAQ